MLKLWKRDSWKCTCHPLVILKLWKLHIARNSGLVIPQQCHKNRIFVPRGMQVAHNTNFIVWFRYNRRELVPQRLHETYKNRYHKCYQYHDYWGRLSRGMRSADSTALAILW
eukprot:TRINITY_DN446_c0_g1_i14.p1 TRINITY_DN446_c0_g1~~TRINITY_DN446_c0_g1_i14.p1  ORF type:complete len:112 (+),score=6.87 TRINITY_DN446_c0_g1_i14:238-573(+)